MIGKKDSEVKVNPEDVKFSSDSNTVIIKNIISVSEDFGKNISEENGGAFGYLKFSVTNKTTEKRDFQIYITKNDVASKEINSNYITFYLTDSDDNPFDNYTGNKLPTYNDLDVKEKKNFTLRVWIDDSYLVVGDEEIFSFEIGARAV